jgi:hypothetical protein
MKRVIAMAALAAMAGVAAGQDGEVRFNGGGAFNGGAFNMEAVTDIAGTGIKAGRAFQTFCIELGEQIGNGKYNVRVNDGAVTGSTTPGQDTDGDPNNMKDVISNETAYLFTQFWNGDINFDNDLNRDRERGLQLAFWFFEERIGELRDTDNDQLVDTFVVTASGVGSQTSVQREFAFDFIQDALSAGWTNIGKVRVLNIGTIASNYDRQDMLIMIPLPGAAATAGLGLLAVGARRRRSMA